MITKIWALLGNVGRSRVSPLPVYNIQRFKVGKFFCRTIWSKEQGSQFRFLELSSCVNCILTVNWCAGTQI